MRDAKRVVLDDSSGTREHARLIYVRNRVIHARLWAPREIRQQQLGCVRRMDTGGDILTAFFTTFSPGVLSVAQKREGSGAVLRHNVNRNRNGFPACRREKLSPSLSLSLTIVPRQVSRLCPSCHMDRQGGSPEDEETEEHRDH